MTESNNLIVAAIANEIAADCHRQISVWGSKDHESAVWLDMIAQDLRNIADDITRRQCKIIPAILRQNLIRAAASAAACVRCIDTKGPEEIK